MCETEEKGQLFTVNVQEIYLVIFKVYVMCNCLLPSPSTSIFFSFEHTFIFNL